MIDVLYGHRFLRISRDETFRVVRRVLRGERASIPRLSVVYTSDPVMRRMNRRYLRHDRTTDVISFSLGDARNPECEIYVNLDRSRVQARRYGVSFATESKRLLIHGLLHALRYDDRTPAQKRRMTKREDVYLSGINQ
ncbi:MAG TPA: rRNA maturation RNase YbeY [Bacteroidota bacterium]|nr:rRNA maturation RNase YbeY [Bacteroidota bacterium]